MINNPQLLTKLTAAALFLKRHVIFLLVLLFAATCAYILFLTSSIIQAEPDANAVAEQSKISTRFKISDQTIKTINSLEAMNVQVQTIFKEARDNPFSE